MNRWPEAAAHVPESSLEHATAVIDALAGAGAIATTGAQVERLCPAIALLIRLRYLDGAVRIGGLDQLAAAARDAEDVRHFITELVLDPPASSADLAGPPHVDEDFLVLSTVHSAKGLEWDAVHRPHRSLELRPPRPKPTLKVITPAHQNAVQRRDQLGGLIQRIHPRSLTRPNKRTQNPIRGRPPSSRQGLAGEFSAHALGRGLEAQAGAQVGGEAVGHNPCVPT